MHNTVDKEFIYMHIAHTYLAHTYFHFCSSQKKISYLNTQVIIFECHYWILTYSIAACYLIWAVAVCTTFCNNIKWMKNFKYV